MRDSEVQSREDIANRQILAGAMLAPREPCWRQGYLPVSQTGRALLFHLLSKLYEHTSVVITTNLSSGEVAIVFDDARF